MIKKILKYTGRSFLVLFTALIGVLVALLLTINTFCNGPSPAAKDVFTTTILETGALKFLASWFLSSEEIQASVDQNSMKAMSDEVNTSLIVVKTGSSADKLVDGTETGRISAEAEIMSVDDNDEPIEITEIAGRTFFATMMIVKDPSKVSIAAAYPWKYKGVDLSELVEASGAIGGINGGIYDNALRGSGGTPYGVVVSNGEVLMNRPQFIEGLVFIGLTNDNILVVKNLKGMDSNDMLDYIEEVGVRDGVCFQEESSDRNNHFVQLIINGNKREMNGMGSGLNPRTAIGQRADGALLLLVTDGRGADGHLGASASDLISIMSEYGAVNAANLDGGSSSCMYYKGEYLMDSVSFYYANSSWLLPCGFVVKE